MMRKMLVFLGIVFCFVAVPLTVWAGSQTFTPPAEKGKIYVIVRFGGTSGIVPKDVKINIKWGSWQKSGAFNSGGGRTPKEGFVIRLDHKKNDSVPLTVTTSAEGNIDNIYQGGEPSQKSSGNWHYVEW
jgi:hypothetical protein